MAKVTVDGVITTVPEGITILSAARTLGITIPALCFDERHAPHCSCLVCCVKVEGRDGFLPSCVAPVADGMVVHTATDEVVAARTKAVELLLDEHAGDCEAPCTRICPCGMDIPRMARLIARGNFREALAVVRETMALPGVLGWICPAPCEKGCRRKLLDGTIKIRSLHRMLAEMQHSAADGATSGPGSTGKRVACVGAGPAGLSAAYYLARSGHEVTLFDRHERPGGMLAFGVPAEVLPPAVLEADIDSILRIGITFRGTAVVSETFTVDRLLQDYDAVVLAVGSGTPGSQQKGRVTVGTRTFTINQSTLTTDLPGVFACGAMVLPGKMAARAVGQGCRVAASVNRYFQNPGDRPEVVARVFDAFPGPLSAEELDALAATDIAHTAGVKETGGTPFDAAVSDAVRCLQCDCGKKKDCSLRRAAAESGILRQPHRTGKRRTIDRRVFKNGLVYEPGKCILCGKCVALTSGVSPGVAFTGRGFAVCVEAPFNSDFEAAMGDKVAECVTACPTGALWVRKGVDDA